MSDYKCQRDILVFILLTSFLLLKGRGPYCALSHSKCVFAIKLAAGQLSSNSCLLDVQTGVALQIQVIPSILLPTELSMEFQRILFKEQYFKELLLLVSERTGICVCLTNVWKDSFIDFFCYKCIIFMQIASCDTTLNWDGRNMHTLKPHSL